MPKLPDGQFGLAAALIYVTSDSLTLTYMAAGGMEDIYIQFAAKFNDCDSLSFIRKEKEKQPTV